MIFQKTRTQNLADVRSLNMWGYQLEDVSILSGLVNVETLSLPINNISTLAPFSACRNLRSLLLRQNRISSFQELEHLRDLPHLSTLSLSDNPIALEPNYRETVLRKLPQLRKLDDVEVSVKVDTFATNENAMNGAKVERLLPRPGRQPMLRASEASGMKQKFNLGQMVREVQVQRAPRQKNDSPLLTAVLALLPQLTVESLQIVLESIEKLCASS
jgi:hypothetical protein